MLQDQSVQRNRTMRPSDMAKTGMWRQRHMAMDSKRLHPVGACFWIVAFLLALMTTDRIQAQPSQAATLDTGHAQQIFLQAESWMKAGQAPSSVSPLWVSDAAGVRLTLRWLAMPLGSGQACSWSAKGNPSDTQPVVDLSELARQAAIQAIGQANQTLKQANGHSSDAPKKTAARSLSDLASVLTLEVEIARQPQAISLSPSAGSEALFDQWVWNWHGLLIQRDAGESTPRTSWLWPGEMIANNISPPGQVSRLLADVGGTIKDQPRLARPSGWSGPSDRQGIPLWKFRTLHLIRSRPGQPTTFLVRGSRPLAAAAVNGATIDSLADRLTAHLIQKTQQDGQVSGSYAPSSDRYEPAVANEDDTALVALALAWRTRYLQTVQGDSPTLKNVSQAARRISLHLTDRIANPTGSRLEEPTAAALLLMALTQGPDLADQKPARDRLVNWLLLQQQKDGLFRLGSADQSKPAPWATQAIVLAGLTLAYQQTQEANLAQAIQSSRQAIWKTVPPEKMLSLMPWLAISERTLRQLEGPLPDGPERPQRAARSVAMWTLSELLSRRLLRQAADEYPADMIGGIVFSPAPIAGRGHQPQPDWHTAQALAFWAVLLSQRDVMPSGQVTLGLIDAGLAARYLAQMTFDEPECYYVRSPSDALGGLRLAAWDNRLAPGPNAMALLSLTLLQQTFRQIEVEAAMGTR